MDILVPTTILLHHGEVPCVVVLISRRSSNSTNFLSVKFPLKPSATYLSSYFVSLPSFQ
jgi:hypothetical protein